MTSQSADIDFRQLATITSVLINTSPGNYGAPNHSKIQTGISSQKDFQDGPISNLKQTGDHKQSNGTWLLNDQASTLQSLYLLSKLHTLPFGYTKSIPIPQHHTN